MATDWKQNERGESAMKLWQKLYIVLIVPILIILNIAIFIVWYYIQTEHSSREKSGNRGFWNDNRPDLR